MMLHQMTGILPNSCQPMVYTWIMVSIWYIKWKKRHRVNCKHRHMCWWIVSCTTWDTWNIQLWMRQQLWRSSGTVATTAYQRNMGPMPILLNTHSYQSPFQPLFSHLVGISPSKSVVGKGLPVAEALTPPTEQGLPYVNPPTLPGLSTTEYQQVCHCARHLVRELEIQ